jgi:hypothetical protein
VIDNAGNPSDSPTDPVPDIAGGFPLIEADLIGEADLDQWMGEMYVASVFHDKQHTAFQNLNGSLLRLIAKRGSLHSAGLAFYGIPANNKSLHQVQWDLYFASETYFQGLYSSLSQLANVTHRFGEVFPGIAYSSNEKFLTSMARTYPDIAAECEVLESGRQHRTFLDHPASNQVSSWMTHTTNDGRGVDIQHFGDAGPTGNIPVGATREAFGVEADWSKGTPNHLVIEPALKAVLIFIVGSIMDFDASNSPN